FVPENRIRSFVNPMWDVAEVARTSAGGDALSLGLPPDVMIAKSGGPSLEDQMTQMRAPWYWLGWMEDPSLQHSGPMHETIRGDYFTMALLKDGPYPLHALFMLTKKQIEQGCNPAAWNTPDRRQMIEIQYSMLLLNDGLPRWEPALPACRQLFRSLM